MEGLYRFDRKHIEDAIKVSHVTIHVAFKPLVPPSIRVSNESIRNVIAALAVERGSFKVIGEAVAMKLASVADLSKGEKRKALLTLLA